MGRRREPIRQDVIVERFAVRLRELRVARGLTQVELSRAANIATSYAGRLERGLAAPGLDLMARLATALGVPVTELVVESDPPDPVEALKAQARRLLEEIIRAGDRDALQVIVPVLARFGGGPSSGR